MCYFQCFPCWGQLSTSAVCNGKDLHEWFASRGTGLVSLNFPSEWLQRISSARISAVGPQPSFHLSHLRDSIWANIYFVVSHLSYLSVIILNSRDSQIWQDKLSGAYWLKRAATQHLPAQLMLGEMLLKGDGVKRVVAAKERFFGCHIFFAWKDVVLSSSYRFAMR